MTVSSVTPIDQASTAAKAAAATDSTSAGRTRLAENFDMFLTLLTTQMKNQDPTSPMDSNQFMAQLVQMTGVEQQLATNDLLKQLVSNTTTSLANVVDLIGKNVRAATDETGLVNGEAKWGYSLPANADDVKIEVLDSNGLVVRSVAPTGDDIKAGEHTFTWDGKNDAGAAQPAGTYKLRITAKDSAGETVTSSIYVQGVVTGVEQRDGQGLVTINGGKAPMSSITSINQTAAAPAAGADDSNTNNPADQTSA
jgi:flagellar basal-body rod modification protein FlgD